MIFCGEKCHHSVIFRSQKKTRIITMQRRTLYITPFLFAFLCFSPLTREAGAAKYNGAYYRELYGALNNGGKTLKSTLFENHSVMEELAVSSQSVSNLENRSGSLSYFPIPQTVSNLKPVNISTYSIKVNWTAPYGDLSKNNTEVDHYILKYSTVNLFSDSDGFKRADEYAQAWIPLSPGENEVRIVDGFNPGTTYYFSVESVNSYSVRSEFSNVALAAALTPAPPVSLKISQGDVNKVNLSWLSPSGFSSLIEFSDRAAPSYPYEIKNYQVFRAVSPFEENWQFIAEVSSATPAYTDTIDIGAIYYYYVKAVNEAGSSRPSQIKSNGSDSIFFVSDDKMAVFEAPKAVASLFETSTGDQMQTYSVYITSSAQDVTPRVVKSMEFKAYRGGIIPDSNFTMPDKASVKLYYAKNGSEIIPSQVTDEKKISMYYYNGAKWFNLYGDVDPINNSVELKTSLLGKYQLRLTERTNNFSADSSGLSNRFLTPNGDGKNDNMVFIFDNPRKVSVKGKLFDLKGAFVADMTEGPVENSLKWNGQFENKPVSGGVYVYQIEAEGKVYNGTVVVIR